MIQRRAKMDARQEAAMMILLEAIKGTKNTKLHLIVAFCKEGAQSPWRDADEAVPSKRLWRKKSDERKAQNQ